MADIYTQSLLSEVAELWETGEGSDMTIKCENREFKVHKVLVSAASPILKAACQNGMKESQTGVVEHKTFDADTLERMLEFIYTRDYTVPWTTPDVMTGAIRTSESDSEADEVLVIGTSARCIAHTRMYAIGDYYQLPTLKNRALEEVQKVAAAPLELRDFVYVVREACKLIGKHETDFHRIIQTVCRENVMELKRDKKFMAALAKVADMQEFSASLLGQVIQELAKEKLDSLTTKVFQEMHLNDARSDVERLQRRIGWERQDHIEAMETFRAQMDHYQAVTEKLMDDIVNLPLRCPNMQCRDTTKAPYTLQREPHATYGDGFVEIQCERCGSKLSK
ncbi:hypothetical protein NU195Hw_g2458t1 [Hortaea werneckii]